MPQPRPVLLLLLLVLPLSLSCKPAADPLDLTVTVEVEQLHLVADGPLWLRLSLYWMPGPNFNQPFERPRVFIHVLDEDKRMVGLGDHRPDPSVDRWQPGQSVTTQRVLLVPRVEPELLRQQLRIRVGLYEAKTPENSYLLTELKLNLADVAEGPSMVRLEDGPPPLHRGWERRRLVTALPAADYRLSGATEGPPVRLVPEDQVTLARQAGKSVVEAPSLGIDIPAGGMVEYALVLPAYTRLIFSVRGETGTTIRVTVHKEGSEERVICEEVVDGDTGLLKFPLTGTADEEAWIRLETVGPGRALWVEPSLETREPRRPERQRIREELQRFRDQASDWNVLLVIQDAARADASSCYGNPRRTTPALDRLARQGMQVVRATAQAPYTLSSTASLFTGLYPTTHQVLSLDDRLPARLPHLVESFQRESFVTACVSASPFTSAAYGMNRGFDYYIDNFKRSEFFTGPDVVRTASLLHPYLAPREDGRDRFFFYVHFLEPHSPYEPPEPFRGQFTETPGPAGIDGSTKTLEALDLGRMEATAERVQQVEALYQGNLMFGDLQLARLLAGLRREGLLEKTLVIVTSDHGEAFNEHGRMLHNSTVHREMLQVPLVLNFPDRSVPHRRLHHQVETVDLNALLSDLFLGDPKQHGIPPEGTSFLPQLAGAPPRPQRLGLALSANGEALGLTSGRFKLIQAADGLRIYHRGTDPGEQQGRPFAGLLPESLARQTLLQHLVQSPPPTPGDETEPSAQQLTTDTATRDQLRMLGYVE